MQPDPNWGPTGYQAMDIGPYCRARGVWKTHATTSALDDELEKLYIVLGEEVRELLRIYLLPGPQPHRIYSCMLPPREGCPQGAPPRKGMHAVGSTDTPDKSPSFNLAIHLSVHALDDSTTGRGERKAFPAGLSEGSRSTGSSGSK